MVDLDVIKHVSETNCPSDDPTKVRLIFKIACIKLSYLTTLFEVKVF